VEAQGREDSSMRPTILYVSGFPDQRKSQAFSAVHIFLLKNYISCYHVRTTLLIQNLKKLN